MKIMPLQSYKSYILLPQFIRDILWATNYCSQCHNLFSSAEYERVIRDVKEVLFGKSYVDVHEKKEQVSIFHFLNQEPDY